MKYLSFFIGLVLISTVVSCKKNTSSKPEKITEIEAVTHADEMEDSLSPALYSAIKSTICLYDSVYHNKRFYSFGKEYANIIKVVFTKREDDCYVTIIDCLYYQTYLLNGYILYQKYMIVFDEYDPVEHELYIKASGYDNACNCNLVNIEKLRRDTPPQEFHDENSEFVNYDFDGIGRRYKIHSRDSLELVFEGFI
ncbi:hypothetical protein M2480_001064 [Parabacteroides sp. PFB2-12]|uniref:hypothetical protein n=1 Tax=unclassified Parabacteroides TaxID=2649774 RepID=UPI0024734F00|nr:MULTISPECIES: hypothetical protein [unclassified Parabacteroides]MDH6342442.1 hypothetical protein [Parabacteroides sp. PM6-13]MDH6390094.1 hypothetical protein [Parabacteroides sp. PFB2-12]